MQRAEKQKSTSRVVVLIATIPPRRRSCERLLAELVQQSRKPDVVILALDGYGDAPAPSCMLPTTEYRTPKPSGPGARWRVAADLPPDDILINLDDDIMLVEAPKLLEALVTAVEEGGGAAAAMGRSADGKPAPPGSLSRGVLIYGAGCGLAVRVRHLQGLQALAAEVRQAGGPDALGPLGDDDALVSAHLWKHGIRLVHAATGNIFPAPDTRSSSQTHARGLRRERLDLQKEQIRNHTGWPWRPLEALKRRRTVGT